MVMKVVATGIAVISSSGYGTDLFCRSLIHGRSGTMPIQELGTNGHTSRIGGQTNVLCLLSISLSNK